MTQLACPVCHQRFTGAEHKSCLACQIDFPSVNGIRVLLHETNSVFRFADHVQGTGYEGASGYAGSLDQTGGLRRAYRRLARHLGEARRPGSHFTRMGHRRLFRPFDEIRSGQSGGPVYAAIQRARPRAALRMMGLLLTYPVRYLDPYLSRTDASYNAARACYFLGRKRETVIPDREIIGMFRAQ